MEFGSLLARNIRNIGMVWDDSQTSVFWLIIIAQWWWLHNFLNIPKTILKEQILWYVNYT